MREEAGLINGAVLLVSHGATLSDDDCEPVGQKRNWAQLQHRHIINSSAGNNWHIFQSIRTEITSIKCQLINNNNNHHHHNNADWTVTQKVMYITCKDTSAKCTTWLQPKSNCRHGTVHLLTYCPTSTQLTYAKIKAYLQTTAESTDKDAGILYCCWRTASDITRQEAPWYSLPRGNASFNLTEHTPGRSADSRPMGLHSYYHTIAGTYDGAWWWFMFPSFIFQQIC